MIRGEANFSQAVRCMGYIRDGKGIGAESGEVSPSKEFAGKCKVEV
jgi:hypothetical protein